MRKTQHRLVYIAGPYSQPDPVQNTANAIAVGELVERELGCAVCIPHLSLVWQLARPAPVGRWYERDLALLERCDAVARFPGMSPGADAEIAHAEALGLDVWNLPTLHELPASAYLWAGRPR